MTCRPGNKQALIRDHQGNRLSSAGGFHPLRSGASLHPIISRARIN
jgi:hypothetical protein